MAGRKLKILIAGGVDSLDEKALTRPAADVCRFAAELAAEVIRQGHSLLNGCRTDIDAAAASAAHQELVRGKASAEEIRRGSGRCRRPERFDAEMAWFDGRTSAICLAA